MWGAGWDLGVHPKKFHRPWRGGGWMVFGVPPHLLSPQAPDAVAGALAAASILRQLSHLEQEAQEAAAMKELAAKFEGLAIGG